MSSLTAEQIFDLINRKLETDPIPDDDDLDRAYEEQQGREQSWNDGSMLGSPNAYKGEL